jgi:hypothetical protein
LRHEPDHPRAAPLEAEQFCGRFQFAPVRLKEFPEFDRRRFVFCFAGTLSLVAYGAAERLRGQATKGVRQYQK